MDSSNTGGLRGVVNADPDPVGRVAVEADLQGALVAAPDPVLGRVVAAADLAAALTLGAGLTARLDVVVAHD